VSTEFGVSEVNQLKAVPNNNNGKRLTLCTPIIPTSFTCAKNCPMCSYMLLASSPLNFAESGILKQRGYGKVSKYSG
jgi:hypothetical protein